MSTRFVLPEHHLPDICLECDYYDVETRECLISAAIFGDCALLEQMIIPELLDESELDGDVDND